MKIRYQAFMFVCFIFSLLCFCESHAQTPVQKNGQLKVIGTKLCNQYNNPIQLRGMSTHGIQWYYQCLNDASLDALAYNWGADILRISLYVQEGGYETDPAGFTAKVTTLINEATERGMYALVDWHQLDPGDPNFNLENARRFFTDIANAHKNKNNIIYDICNEPNNVAWSAIKNYADQIIPVIRAIDADAPIFIGTHGWGSLGISDGRTAQDIVNLPVNFPNIMYTFHFYAASHTDRYLQELDWASDRLPIFVTEFGTQTASGDGTNNFAMAQRYIDLMQTKKIGWTNWNFSDDFRSGAVWNTGTCSGGPWTTAQLKPAGTWVRERMLSPADNFPGGENNPPSATITAPVNGATYTAPAAITINATAADPDGTVAKVEFYQNGVKLGEDTSSPYSFAWANISAGTYGLTAKATDNVGTATTSSVVTIIVNSSNTLPSPWATSDIGTVSPAGNASYSSGTFTVGGAGADIWGTADAFRYVYQAVTGDVEITARVSSLTNTNEWAKAGVMIRQSLSANAAHASALVTPINGTGLQRRTTAGGNSEHTGSTGAAPVWLRLKKTGSSFTASRSTDGAAWTTIGTATVSLTSTYYVGLAVTSHANGTLATSAFSNVSVTTGGTNASPSASITSPVNNTTFTAPASITINATATDSDGTITKVEFFNGATKLGEDTSQPFSYNWTGVTAGSYQLTARATDNASGTGTSAIINITVNAVGNSNPSASIVSPANNASFTAPATINITATASDTDGTITKVDFLNGTALLGTDTSSPYSYSWTGVAAGSYQITARATDNAGGTGTSAVINITVTGGSDNCAAIPQYVENGGYVAGSIVKNAGSRYECKPHPFTGWCNGAAWAYAPGTGTYWQDAWILNGSCSTGRRDVSVNESSLQNEDGLTLSPNPSRQGNRTLTLHFDHTPEKVSVLMQDMNGTEILSNDYHAAKSNDVTLELPLISGGLYILKVKAGSERWVKKCLIE
jgi:aryl-phospho-beta-D-glucosidase BglC (GH1 family)/regulation of enolase protein 1 (concanavalin A-like superfamily)